jgi:hypothetical protein
MKELIKIESVTAVDVFNNAGLDPLLEQIKDEVRSFVPDLSTVTGRKAIASLAAKVAKSKTYLDGLGKDLVADQKAAIKTVDAERKRMRDDLDLLKIEARKPLTDWEDAEKTRVEVLNKRLADIEAMSAEVNPETFEEYGSEGLRSILAIVESIAIDDSWQEFKLNAERAKEQVIGSLSLSIATRKKAEDDQAELDRLRREQKEREQREHEERIANEAAQKAEREAAEKAKQERLRVEQEQQETQRKADQERKSIEDERKDEQCKAEEDRQAARQKLDEEKLAREESDQRAAKAIEDSRIANERAEREAAEKAEQAKKDAAQAEQRRIDDLKKAEEQARQREQDAIERERNRRIQEEQAAAEEARKREANTQHKGAVNRKAVSELMGFAGLTDIQAKKAITAIAKGEIPSVKISY